MNRIFFNGLLFAIFLISGISNALTAQTMRSQAPAKTYEYITVEGDPLQARIYTLENGLTVYLSVNRTEPRIYTNIAVRAGSTSDPADATGLAHYLEHMVFKGTDQYGTLDYEKEKVELDKVEALFEQYRQTTDVDARKALYHQIDSISGVASRYAIANEYDKMASIIGARGTNAGTSHEYTVYINDIPANQLEKWLMLETERFREPVLRLFHTELEAVYEEKNRSLDSDRRLMLFELFDALFPTHNYGQQTTIGTIEHLKNPSITRIKEYFENFYVPNNMAVCLAGDFDPDKTIALIDQYFGKWEASEAIERKTFAPEKPITEPIVREVVGPDAESLYMGFRFPGKKHPDVKKLIMLDMILSNSTAGLIDLNLNQQQKVLQAYSTFYDLNDYSVHILGGSPRQGQTLEEVQALLLEQIELVKQGKFEASLLDAIINDFEVSEIQQSERNTSRVRQFVDAFIAEKEWADVVGELDEMRKITKEDIVEFTKANYGDAYAVVYKRTGERELTQKVTKPEITPVELNREAESGFLEEFVAKEVKPVAPRFLDFEEDIDRFSLSSGVPGYFLENTENELFTLYYLLDMGRDHDPELAAAIQYLPYLGTKNLTPEEFQFKLYSLGTSLNVSAGRDQVYIYVSGLRKNLEPSIELLEDLLRNAKADDAALSNMIDGVLKSRADAKLSKQAILFSGMMSYGKYGEKNPYNNRLNEEELRALSAKKMVKKVAALINYDHRILYYGPGSKSELVSVLNKQHKVKKKRKAIPKPEAYPFAATDKPKVYFVEYDMVQAELVWLSKSVAYNPELSPAISLYNEYFGGGMGSLVFTTIRESKALAYASQSNFGAGRKKGDPYYNMSYIGTQADKIHEAIAAMNELLNDMPIEENAFSNGKEALRRQIETQRIVRTNVLFRYENARKMGIDYDIRQSIYEGIEKMTPADIKKFQETYIKDQPHILLVLGSKENIDMESLKQYGEVIELSLEDVFGY